MAENNIGGLYTLVDLVKMLNPSDGTALFVAQTLARKNPIVKEVPIMEANQILTHVGSRQKSLPTVQKRALNDGVPYSAHKTEVITAPMSLYETMSRVDEELLKLAGANAETFRQGIDASHVEAMSQAIATDIFYGNIGDDPLEFNGLGTMFGVTTDYPNGDSTWYYNVQNNSGTGSDLCSLWMIEWGPNKVHLIYPKNTVGGIEINDLGKQLVSGVTSNTNFVAYVTQFKWRAGLYVQDERCVQRIANIENTGSTNIFNEDLVIKALNRLPGYGEDTMTRIYCNRTIKSQIEIRAKDKANMFITNWPDAFGVPILRVRGVPVQICDALTIAESAIS